MIKKIYGKIKGLVSSKHYKIYETKQPAGIDTPDLSGFSFGLFNAQDLKNTLMCHEKGRLEKFLKRLEEGHLCYGHKDIKTGDVCSYFWVSEGEKVDHAPFAFDFSIKIPECLIYTADCRVDEKCRGKKLYTSGLIEIMKLYEGKKFLITAETDNIISQKGIISAGYKYIGNVSFTKIRDHSFARYRDISEDSVAIEKRK